MAEKFTVLAHEDQAEFDRLLERYLSVLAPKSHIEEFLVELMVQARWRLARIQRLEAAAAGASAAGLEASAADSKIAAELDKGGKGSKLLQRYRKSAEQSYRRAHRELTRIRKRPQPLGPTELTVLNPPPAKLEFADLGDFALRS